MITFLKYREKICSRNLILLSALVYGLFQSIIIWILYPLGLVKVFTLQTTIASSVVRDTFSGWIETGEITRYLFHYYFDFPLPVFYGCLLAALFSKFLEHYKQHPFYSIVTILPLIVGLLDIYENLSHLAFIYIRESITPLWVGLSGTASCVKWILSFLSLLLFALFCIKIVIRKVWRNR